MCRKFGLSLDFRRVYSVLAYYIREICNTSLMVVVNFPFRILNYLRIIGGLIVCENEILRNVCVGCALESTFTYKFEGNQSSVFVHKISFSIFI